MKEKLFREDETYTERGNKLYNTVAEFALKMLKMYKDCPSRDVVTVINDAADFQAVFERSRRRYIREKKIRALKKNLALK